MIGSGAVTLKSYCKIEIIIIEVTKDNGGVIVDIIKNSCPPPFHLVIIETVVYATN